MRLLNTLFFILAILLIPGSLIASQQTSQDAVAIRVMPNLSHYSPIRWYDDQGYQGSPSQIIVDGYEAIQDGNTIYVNAANITDDNKFYTNIYVIAFNIGAEDITSEIFLKIISNIKFNSNLTPSQILGNCKKNEAIACTLDSDCAQRDYCESEKAKIIRDTKRLSDLASIKEALGKYKQEHNGEYPELLSGTYLRHTTISTWPSWQQTLAQELGLDSLPIDPINKLGDCPGFNSLTCWNAINREFYEPTGVDNCTFDLPPDSHAYVFIGDSKGEKYWFEKAANCGDCGNGEIDSRSNEDCEADVGITETCRSQGYSSGELTCGNNCKFDFSQCKKACFGPRATQHLSSARIEHEGNKEYYENSTVACEQSCDNIKDNFTCDDGDLIGGSGGLIENYEYENCDTITCLDCTGPDGATINHRDNKEYYENSSVACDQSCVSQTRICSDGGLSGSYTNANCNPVVCSSDEECVSGVCAVPACVPTARTHTCYSGNVRWGDGCSSGITPCAYGCADGSCIVPNDCSVDGVTILRGTSLDFFEEETPVGACESGPRECKHNGFLDGASIYRHSSCNAGCTIGLINKIHGESHSFYLQDKPPYGRSCGSPQLRTCNNGSFSGDASYSARDCVGVISAEAIVKTNDRKVNFKFRASNAKECDIDANSLSGSSGNSFRVFTFNESEYPQIKTGEYVEKTYSASQNFIYYLENDKYEFSINCESSITPSPINSEVKFDYTIEP